MDPEKMKAQRSQVTSIEKEPAVAERLLFVVGKSPLLRTLDSEQKDMIVKAFSGPLTKQSGEDVIVQGDIGDVFYLLEEGSVDVYIKKKGTTDELKVHTYKPGDAFGELAIMYNSPRAATCRAQTECKLWALDRVSFKVIVVAAAMQKRELYVSFLQQVNILSSLTEMEIMTLADSLAEETFEDGKTMIDTTNRISFLGLLCINRAYD
jgi:cAMP-dependent protein kinase regulator